MSILLDPADSRLSWQGTVSLERTTEWVRPWRIPYWDLEFFVGKMLRERARMPAGVRISFYTDSTRVAGAVVHHGGGVRPIDICVDGEYMGSCEMQKVHSFAFDNLPEGHKLIELWLPQFGYVEIKNIELNDNSSVEPFIDTRPKWITYGSSLTQCRNANSPTKTWPAIVSRTMDWNLTCLGYNGECHLDPMIARTIRDLPADLISLCVGVNIYGKSSLNERTFRSNLYGFIKIIREKHAFQPIAVISPLWGIGREENENKVGLTHAKIREIIIECVDTFNRNGDKQVRHVPGIELFSEADRHLLDDQVHQTDVGIELLAQRFLEKAVPVGFPDFSSSVAING